LLATIIPQISQSIVDFLLIFNPFQKMLTEPTYSAQYQQGDALAYSANS
jgi:hypothetical protein